MNSVQTLLFSQSRTTPDWQRWVREFGPPTAVPSHRNAPGLVLDRFNQRCTYDSSSSGLQKTMYCCSVCLYLLAEIQVNLLAQIYTCCIRAFLEPSLSSLEPSPSFGTQTFVAGSYVAAEWLGCCSMQEQLERQEQIGGFPLPEGHPTSLSCHLGECPYQQVAAREASLGVLPISAEEWKT